MTTSDSTTDQTSPKSSPHEQQPAQAGEGSTQEPAKETAQIRSGVAKKASSVRDSPVQPNPAVTNHEVLAGRSPFTPQRQAAASLEQVRPRNLAISNDIGMDSSVDTDGKASEAKQDLPILRDHVISSNASLDDSVDTPDENLGGIESRPGGNVPLIAAAPGYRVEYLGSVSEISPWLALETAATGRRPDISAPEPFNGTRSAHLFRFVRSK